MILNKLTKFSENKVSIKLNTIQISQVKLLWFIIKTKEHVPTFAKKQMHLN